ncbi:type 1 fimbrial protein [Salmonella enterica]|nr:type 1 fimbrial protein [Salmonella enterica]ELJ2931538.1 type 1 fimbrial protein [Salmonella enterica subsp. enterica]EDJ4952294.1 hypothetical protein [Salmonella enterica]EGB2280608.1 type 1 fimbrial protein [Salmonella enterica]EGH0940759.1 type 1 fimbrial protein [Salmonella enterica]
MFLYKLKIFSVCVALSMFMTGSAVAEVLNSTTVDYKIKILPPSCRVNVPPLVAFGDVGYNTQRDGTRMSVNINCDNPVSTKIVASLVNTDLVNDTTAAMMRVQGGGRSGATLRLYETTNNFNQYVKLTGKDTDNFCNGRDDRVCTLIPKLTTGEGEKMINGQARATIKFDLIYM